MPRARISERLLILILRWTRRMIVRATKSQRLFTSCGGKEYGRTGMGYPCDLAGKSHLDGYWAQSRLWPFPAGRTSRRNPRGTAEFLRGSVTMNNPPKTVIVTGASQGIAAGIVRAFLAREYKVVGTDRHEP